LTLQLQVRDQLGAIESLECLASVAARQKNYEQAARLHGTTAASRERLCVPLPQWERGDRQEVESAARQSLGDATYQLLAREGAKDSLEDAARALASAPTN
jgi:hypothetical protein